MPSNQYETLLEHVYKTGVDKNDRTGVGTRSVFGYQMRFNLAEGFPLVTTKKLHIRSIVHELLWFLSGSSNIKYLHDNGVSILCCISSTVTISYFSLIAIPETIKKASSADAAIC